MNNNINDTIAIIATPNLNCAISIIRVSGNKCYQIINKLLKKPLNKKGYTFVHRTLYENNFPIDDVIILQYVKPKSFTGEDMIEINCHGGVLITNKILNLLIKNGAKLANKGEFSKRAFLNNKLTFKQANAINNLVFAKSETTLKIAANNLINNNQTFFETIKDNLFNLIGKIEVNIDYPEYLDVEIVTYQLLETQLNNVINQLKTLINNYNKFAYVFNGINVAIIGKPNVGKSSLLNAILKKDKAIVSNIKGTTRDLINESINYENLLLNFIDTAGIRSAKNEIELLGIKKTKNTIKQADLILFVIDNSKKISASEIAILKQIKNTKHIVIKNKMDLNIDANPNIEGIKVSAKKNKISELLTKIKDYFASFDINTISDLAINSDNEKLVVNEILKNLTDCLKAVKKQIPLDLLVTDLTIAYQKLCSLLGLSEQMDLINQMFANFCLGK